MFTITNGFTYIAFLMFLAGGLLALEKYAKWKVFNVVPPLVWIYVLNMVFCTMGLYASDACSAVYSALKNNLLYAMIFVMLLRCDFRKLAKLGGRMIAIFLACSLTLGLGFLVFYPVFMGPLGGGEKTWAAVAALYASWVGGSANMAAMQDALPVDAGSYSCALALDTVCYSVWIALLLLAVSIGAILYYIVLQVVLSMGMNPNYLKLLSAAVVAVFLSVPYWKGKYFSKPVKKGGADRA